MGFQDFFCRAFPFALCFCVTHPAFAVEREVGITETSSTGKTIRLNIGRNSGLNLNEPILLESNGEKRAMARVIRLSEDSAVATVVEGPPEGQKLEPGPYLMVFGEPKEEGPNLPEPVVNPEIVESNPADERFLAPESQELDNTPDLDDENYTPEVTLRPKLPEARTYSSNNLFVGVELFRNRIPADSNSNGVSFASYQGYTFRYAYTFLTSFWLKEKHNALLSFEGALGIYDFPYTAPNSTATMIRDTPISFDVRYMLELNRLLRIYPYIGYQVNIIGATGVPASYTALKPLQSSRLLAGGGAQMLVSDAIDARLDGGTDGISFGLVVKF